MNKDFFYTIQKCDLSKANLSWVGSCRKPLALTVCRDVGQMQGCLSKFGYRNLEQELGGTNCLLYFGEGCSGISGGGALMSVLMTVLLISIVDK